jgi:hypothetical protein
VRSESRRAPPSRDPERAQGEPRERETDEPRPRSLPTARGGKLAVPPMCARAHARRGRLRQAPNGRLVLGQRDRARPHPGLRPSRRGVRPRSRAVYPAPRRRNLVAARIPLGSTRRRASPGKPRARHGLRRNMRRRRCGRTCARRGLDLLRAAGNLFRRGRLRPGRRIGGTALTRRKQGERIDVPVWLCGQANSEVHGRHARCLSVKLRRGEHVPLSDGRARAHGEGAEVQERDRVTVLGPQGDRPSASGNRSCEGDYARDRREHLLTRSRGDVDAPMLPGLVGVAVDVEGSKYRAGDGPAPGRRRGGPGQRPDGRHQGCPAAASVARSENHAATVSGPSAVVKIVYNEPR